MIEFKPFGKMTRLGGVVITEKMDGTNSAIGIDGTDFWCQSRNRVITPDDDNHGFARWAYENQGLLVELLGDGVHFGEWCGPGINGNRHKLDHKRLYLFNTSRWEPSVAWGTPLADQLTTVNVIIDDDGTIGYVALGELMQETFEDGWWRSGWPYEPEGVVVYHKNLGTYQKFRFDQNPKGPKANEHDVLAERA